MGWACEAAHLSKSAGASLPKRAGSASPKKVIEGLTKPPQRLRELGHERSKIRSGMRRRGIRRSGMQRSGIRLSAEPSEQRQ